MYRGIKTIIICILALGVVFTATSSAMADSNQGILFAVSEFNLSNNGDLDGTYWFRMLGAENFEDDIEWETNVTYGYVTFDGSGNWDALMASFSDDGGTGSDTPSGTYAVQPDGSFNFVVDNPDPEPDANLTGRVAAGGEYAVLSQGEEDGNGDISQEIIIAVKRVGGQTFGNSDLDGSYRFRMLQLFHQPGETEAEVASAIISFDGTDSFTAWYFIQSSSGHTDSGIATGTYLVDVDGTVLLYEDGNVMFSGYIASDKQSMILSSTRAEVGEVTQGLGVAFKINNTRTYAEDDLDGTYNFRMLNFRDIDTVDPEAEIVSGTVMFDGSGTWSTSGVLSFESDGTTSAPSVMPAGIYTVNPDGSMALILTNDPTSPNETWTGGFSDDGNAICLTHSRRPGAGAVPAIDLDGWGAVNNTRPSATELDHDLDLWVKIIDHDGIAPDGSSHTVTVYLPDDTMIPMYFESRQRDTVAYYGGWVEYLDNNVPAGEYTFRVVDQNGNISETVDDLTVDPINPPDPASFSPADGAVMLDTTPTFTWNPLTFVNPPAGRSPNRYRVRIYTDDLSQTVWRGNLGNQTTYTVPPGVLNPGTTYRYRIEARDTHSPFEVDNYVRAPASNSDNFSFTTGTESVDPFIDLDSAGAQIWNNAHTGSNNPWFWIKVHDAQGVPGDIRSVKVTYPVSGREEFLYYDIGNGSNTPTSGIYRRSSSLPVESGTYTFTVEDQAGHEDSVTEVLTPDPIGFPDAASLTPVQGTLLGGTAGYFDWDDVSDPGVAFYRVEIHDINYDRVYNFDTTDSEYYLPAGYLENETLYRYRIVTRREFFDQNVDNVSESPWATGLQPSFLTTPLVGGSNSPSLNLDNWGVVVYQSLKPGTVQPEYALEFQVNVTDGDGVPANIKSVSVIYPDGATTRNLNYDEYESDTEAVYRIFEMVSDPNDIQPGVYTFRVSDFDGNETTVTDTLAGPVVDLILPIPANLTPQPDTTVASLTPTIDWDDIMDAASYRVRIYDGWNSTIHWSDPLTASEYSVPTGVLSLNSTFSYRVYAYREAVLSTDVDYTSVNTLYFYQALHFTTVAASLSISIPAAATEGDGVLTDQGTVSVSEALISDLTVFLSSSDDTEVTVPASVDIPAGSTSTNFDLTIIDDLDIDGTRTATITASTPGWASTTDTIDVQDNDDSDTDAMADWWETQYFGNLSRDGTGDFDNDDLNDLAEYQNETFPDDFDSDDDLMADGWEINYNLDPLDDTDASVDSDGDGLSNLAEYQAGRHPNNREPDTPVLTQPPDLTTGVELAPILETDVFIDNDPVPHGHATTDWQISTQPGDFSDGVLAFKAESDLSLTSLAVPGYILVANTTYYWRARFHDDGDAASEWSAPFEFETGASTITDNDGNGIDDTQDLDPAAQGNVDLDDNNNPDIGEQSDTWKCLNTVVGNGLVGIVVPANCIINSVESIDPATIADTNNRPDNLPLGLLSFSVTVPNVGDNIDITAYLSGTLPANTEWYVWTAAGGWQQLPATFSQTAAGDTKVVFTKTDGGVGDADGLANGVIVDPSGPGSAAAQITLPLGDGGGGGCFISAIADLKTDIHQNLSSFALLSILFVLMGVYAVAHVRKR